MKNTGTPAYTLTANCILNSFRNSGRSHIILTGSKGSGKTTLLSELFPEKLPGLTSLVEHEKGVYLRNNISDETVQIGIYNPYSTENENKMFTCREGFISLGINCIDNCKSSESDWITIDEIGYLEAQCDEYITELKDLFRKKHVAAVVRKQSLPFLNELINRDDVFVVDLDDPFGNIGCVIMASGLGKRFGANKLMVDFGGKPLISYILDATEDIFKKRVVVTKHSEVKEFCESRGVKVIYHDLPYRSDTIRLGLESMSDTQGCMFAVADQPLLKRDTVIALALGVKNDPDVIWRTAFKDDFGSPVIFPKHLYNELLELKQSEGGGVVVRKYKEHLRTLIVENECELKDIDSPDDLKLLSDFHN